MIYDIWFDSIWCRQQNKWSSRLRRIQSDNGWSEIYSILNWMEWASLNPQLDGVSLTQSIIHWMEWGSLNHTLCCSPNLAVDWMGFTQPSTGLDGVGLTVTPSHTHWMMESRGVGLLKHLLYWMEWKQSTTTVLGTYINQYNWCNTTEVNKDKFSFL